MRNYIGGGIGAVVICAILCVSGCSEKGDSANGQLLTRNMQFATLHSTGQVAVVTILDNKAIEEVPLAQATLVGCLTDAKTIVNGTVTVGNLKSELNKVVPIKYQALVSQALIFVEGVSLPTDKLGANNVKRLSEFFDGGIARATAYDTSARNKALTTPAKGGVEIKLVEDFYKPVVFPPDHPPTAPNGAVEKK